MIPIIFLLLLIFSIDNSVAGSTSSVYINSHTFHNSEPVPANDFEEDWDTTFRPGERFVSHRWHEVGTEFHRWGIGFVHRNNAYMEFSTDSALAVHTLVNKQAFLQDTYAINIEGSVFKAAGLRLFYKIFDKPNFQWRFGATSLYGLNIIHGSVKGEMNSISDSDYDFDNIVLDYYYSKDEIFTHEVDKPKGYGFTFDTNIEWDVTPSLAFKLTARDIMGRIYWKDTPLTVATVESDNKTYDENNYVKVDPLLSGNQSTKNFTQHLPFYFFSQAKFKFHKKTFVIFELEHFKIKTFARFGLGAKLPKNSQGILLYDPKNEAFGINFQHKLLKLSYMSDHLNPNKAHLLTFSIAMIYQF